MPPVDERPCRIMGGRGVALNLMIFYSVYEKGHALCMPFETVEKSIFSSLKVFHSFYESMKYY